MVGQAGDGANGAVRQSGPSWREVARWLVLLVAAVAAGRAVVLFRAPERPELLASPLLWLALAAVLFGAVTLGVGSDQPFLGNGLMSPSPARLGRRPQRLAIFAVALGLGVIAAYALHLAPQQALILGWLAAQVLWVAALVPGTAVGQRPVLRERVGDAGVSGYRRWPSWRTLAEVGAATAVLAVAAWLRLWDRARIPLALHGDMASVGLQARELLAGHYDDFFGTGWAAIPILGYAPTALSLLVFGDSLPGLNTVPAIEGLASLAGLYLLVRELWGWRPALFATALATGNLVHIHYSRAAAYMDPVPFVVWTLYLLVRGLRRGRTWELALAGVTAGWAIQMYYSGRIVLPVAGVALALAAVQAPRVFWARRWILAAGAVGLALALGPALVYYARHPGIFDERTRLVSVWDQGASIHTAGKYHLQPTDSAGILEEQFRRSALAFWKYNDAASQLGIERQMLDPVGGGLLILGLGYAIFRLRRPGPLLALVWVGGYVVSAAITVDPPSSQRLVGLTLPAAILGGLALERGLLLLAPARRRALAAVAVGLVVVGSSIALNWRDYSAWATNPRSAGPRVQIARYLLTQPADYQVRIVSRDFSWRDRELQFLLTGRRGGDLGAALLARGEVAWPDGPAIFILTPEARGLSDRLQANYPSGRLVDGSLPPLTGVFWAFLTPPPPPTRAAP